jgi:hypothetical protein
MEAADYFETLLTSNDDDADRWSIRNSGNDLLDFTALNLREQ